MAMSRRGVRTIAMCAMALVLVVFALAVRARWGGPAFAHGVSDIGQAAAALIASLAALWRARLSDGRTRLSWLLLAGGTAGWALGQGVWSYYELVSTQATPFPSYADIGFLLFPVLALPGLLVRPSAAFVGRGRLRLVLDGMMVAASLFSLSWVTAIGQVYRGGAESMLGEVVGLAYPASDLVMITVAVLIVVQARARAGLLLLICGLSGMAIADSGFSYLTALGTYSTGSAVDIGWAASFLLLGLAALLDTGSESRPLTRTASAGYLVLPYFIVLAGIAATASQIIDGSSVDLAVSAVAIVALLVRQLLTLLDNRQLTDSVALQREELRYRAFHDTLTGLANRALFNDRLSHALDLHQRDLRPVSLLFIDLDDFKIINDTLGHDAGDQVLIAVSERLRATMRSGDTVARLGGDEFAILLEDGGDPPELAARVLTALEVPVPIGARRVPVNASIGMTTVRPEQSLTDSQELLKRADTAMYAAKRMGKATAVNWAPELQGGEPDDLDLRLDLADAVTEATISVAYQPILWMDGTVYGHEALARWRRRDEQVPPSTFVAVADRAGLLNQLDMTVIAKALAVTAITPSLGMISVNIGLSHLADPTLVGRLARLLQREGVDPSRLIVEVPEEQAIDRPEVLSSLRDLRSLGVQLALDDFGVGYSSLSRIGSLNPDIIKLDRSFAAPLSRYDRHADVVAGIIDLAHRLGTIVIAEGVETHEQLHRLRSMGCDAVQGYLLGRPTEDRSNIAEVSASASL
jgi:diguanylate cyclase (GGDEF)-like protein